jgi:hypothetical protein
MRLETPKFVGTPTVRVLGAGLQIRESVKRRKGTGRSRALKGLPRLHYTSRDRTFDGPIHGSSRIHHVVYRRVPDSWLQSVTVTACVGAKRP